MLTVLGGAHVVRAIASTISSSAQARSGGAGPNALSVAPARRRVAAQETVRAPVALVFLGFAGKLQARWRLPSLVAPKGLVGCPAPPPADNGSWTPTERWTGSDSRIRSGVRPNRRHDQNSSPLHARAWSMLHLARSHVLR